MPNPLFLKVMGVELTEYNTYSPEKKERFQKVAAKKLGELHESDIKTYCQLTAAVEAPVAEEEKSSWEEKEKF